VTGWESHLAHVFAPDEGDHDAPPKRKRRGRPPGQWVSQKEKGLLLNEIFKRRRASEKVEEAGVKAKRGPVRLRKKDVKDKTAAQAAQGRR